MVTIHQIQLSGLHLERRRARQHQKLHERHHYHLPDHHLVAKNLQVLLADQNADNAEIQDHATRGLKLRTAAVMSTIVIAPSTSVSRHRYSSPTPLSMIPRAMMMNQRAGTIVLNHWSAGGMLAKGNTIPERSALGSIVASNATSIATR